MTRKVLYPLPSLQTWHLGQTRADIKVPFSVGSQQSWHLQMKNLEFFNLDNLAGVFNNAGTYVIVMDSPWEMGLLAFKFRWPSWSKTILALGTQSWLIIEVAKNKPENCFEIDFTKKKYIVRTTKQIWINFRGELMELNFWYFISRGKNHFTSGTMFVNPKWIWV